MFLLTCPICQCDYLVGARSVRGLHNVRPGVIVLELSCPHGHRVLEMTGNRAAGRVDTAQRVPTHATRQPMPSANLAVNH